MKMRSKLSKGGKLSIPSNCRKHLNLKEGEEVVFTLKEGEIVISPVRLILERVRKNINKYHSSNESLVDQLIADRRNEAKNE
ncbi:MAG: hypothetical protein K0Q51_715 [Rickettsiaceae bacterium]|jgi:AbrB family looped-hinge helix DNA binding protein|nr:hypothetical protein [Rickettsiaceae bacterium]